MVARGKESLAGAGAAPHVPRPGAGNNANTVPATWVWLLHAALGIVKQCGSSASVPHVVDGLPPSGRGKNYWTGAL